MSLAYYVKFACCSYIQQCLENNYDQLPNGNWTISAQPHASTTEEVVVSAAC